MKRESVGRTFLVATCLCVCCSIVVSVAAVGLRPLQESNKNDFKRKNILIAAKLYDEDQPIDEQFKQIDTLLIDLSTGLPVDSSVVDPESYDQREAASSPETSEPIDPAKDYAKIKRREKYSFVYLVKENGAVQQIILPVYGKGLWSTMYGFLSIDDDTTTVRGITFYAHGETPGLGGEIENPRWQALWPGKEVYDEDGEVALQVIKGTVDPGSDKSKYQIDGLSGATITSQGVSGLIRYWMSEEGFGPFLERFRAERPARAKGVENG